MDSSNTNTIIMCNCRHRRRHRTRVDTVLLHVCNSHCSPRIRPGLESRRTCSNHSDITVLRGVRWAFSPDVNWWWRRLDSPDLRLERKYRIFFTLRLTRPPQIRLETLPSSLFVLQGPYIVFRAGPSERWKDTGAALRWNLESTQTRTVRPCPNKRTIAGVRVRLCVCIAITPAVSRLWTMATVLNRDLSRGLQTPPSPPPRSRTQQPDLLGLFIN